MPHVSCGLSNDLTMMIKTLKLAKRVILIVFGFTLLAIGLVLAIPGVPGPGFFVMLAGLAVLAVEFVWARNLLNRLKEQGARLKEKLVSRNKPKP